MIKLVLLDLDDTLITTNTEAFTSQYFRELGKFMSSVYEPDLFIKQMMSSYARTLQTYDPMHSLYDRLLSFFVGETGLKLEELEPMFQAFYENVYPELCQSISPRPEASKLLDMLAASGLKIVIATNPALPLIATAQRMSAGGLSTDDERIEFITTLDHMRFGKPQPEYYAEILMRMDVEPYQVLMVGDDWKNDIVPSAAMGLNTYWVTDTNKPPEDSTEIVGYGTISDLINNMESGWTETLKGTNPAASSVLSQLSAYPARLAVLYEEHSERILECRPGENEWSVRDVICHLRDREYEEQGRLHRVLGEDNPFLTINVDPWSEGESYRKIAVREALMAFASRRSETIRWLGQLPDDVWSRPARDPIFGPTTFCEVVRFITKHDHTHLHQMYDAVSYAYASCS